MKNPPSVDRLNELFELRDGDGLLYRRTKEKFGRPIGSVVASKHTHSSYKLVTIDTHRYTVHQVVFAITHNHWPTGFIDHINGNPVDNRPDNLREATPCQNAYNCKMNSTNKSGVRGVSKSYGKWMAQIRVGGKVIYLGRYDDIDLAALVRSEAARRYHGEFARAE